MIGNHILYLSYSLPLPYKTILLEVIIPVLGDGCWVLSLNKTILLDEIMPCMWINLILLTIYTFNGRTKLNSCSDSPHSRTISVSAARLKREA